MKKITYAIIFFNLLSYSTAALAAPAVMNSCAKNKKECVENLECECYCSRKCGPRKKEVDDIPVYIANDPAGHYCYCNQWDVDNYDEYCKKEDTKKSQVKKVK